MKFTNEKFSSAITQILLYSYTARAIK